MTIWSLHFMWGCGAGERSYHPCQHQRRAWRFGLLSCPLVAWTSSFWSPQNGWGKRVAYECIVLDVDASGFEYGELPLPVFFSNSWYSWRSVFGIWTWLPLGVSGDMAPRWRLTGGWWTSLLAWTVKCSSWWKLESGRRWGHYFSLASDTLWWTNTAMENHQF